MATTPIHDHGEGSTTSLIDAKWANEQIVAVVSYRHTQ